MKIAFFDTHSYDKASFAKANEAGALITKLIFATTSSTKILHLPLRVLRWSAFL